MWAGPEHTALLQESEKETERRQRINKKEKSVAIVQKINRDIHFAYTYGIFHNTLTYPIK